MYQYMESGPVPLWGFQIPECGTRLQWIKLGLEPDQEKKVMSRLSSKHRDRRQITEIPHHTSAEGMVTDYLRCLHDHILRLLESKIGRSFDGMSMEFVITVPAMWSDRAKMTTLSCAENAGFGDASKIRIISEPEAAAIHSLQGDNPHKLEVGDTIVICDAGGGTVDLITFSILALEPDLRLKEEAPGDGSLCGSAFLNMRFEEFLEERLSSLSGWDREAKEEAIQRFEEVAKRRFEGNTNDEFRFNVPGVEDNKEAGVHRGRLRVTGQEIDKIFLPVLRAVRDLVDEQIQTSMAKVKSVLLVGGFGQNRYLGKFLRDSFPGVDVLTPVNAWSAVVRGALRKVLADTAQLHSSVLIESRVARKHYGTTKYTKFIPGTHDEKKKCAPMSYINCLSSLSGN